MAVIGQYKCEIQLTPGPQTQSFRIVVYAYHLGSLGSGVNSETVWVHTYDWNVSPLTPQTHILRHVDQDLATPPTQPSDHLYMLPDIGASVLKVILTPYDAADGAKGTGTAGETKTLYLGTPASSSIMRAEGAGGANLVGAKMRGTGGITMSFSSANNIIEVDGSGAGGYTTLGSLTDTTISSPVTGHFLRYDSGSWVNTLLIAADIPDLSSTYAAATHTHDWSAITSGKPTTLSGYGITDAATSAALTAHTGSTSNPHGTKISNLGDVDLTGLTDGDILYWDQSGNTWAVTAQGVVYSTLGSLTDVTITSVGAGEVLGYNGGWINRTLAEAGIAASADLTSHTSNTSNPHSVTKSQVGLGNVENTALSGWAGSTAITTLGATINQTVIADSDTVNHNAYTNTTQANRWLTSYRGESYATVAERKTARHYYHDGTAFRFVSAWAWKNSHGQLLMDDGAVGAPSYSFIDDEDTGLYYDGTAVSINVAVAGTQRMSIDSTGETIFYGPVKPSNASFALGGSGVTERWNTIYAQNLDITGNFSTQGNFTVDGTGTPGADLYLTNGAVIRNTDGTAAAPSYTFNSDDDTGMYLSSTGVLSLAAGGVSGLAIHSNPGGTYGYLSITPGSGGTFAALGTTSWSGTVYLTKNLYYYKTHASSNSPYERINWAYESGSTSSNQMGGVLINGTNGEVAWSFYTVPVTTGADAIPATFTRIAQIGTNGTDSTTGQIRLVNGSVSLPAYTFSNDPDTGAYLSATGQFSIAAGSAHAVRFKGTSWMATVNPSAAAQSDLLFLNAGSGLDAVQLFAQAGTSRGAVYWSNAATSFYMRTYDHTHSVRLAPGGTSRVIVTGIDADEGRVSIDNAQFHVYSQGTQYTGSSITIDWDLGNTCEVMNQSSTTVPTAINIGAATMLAGGSYVMMVYYGTGGSNGSAVTWTGVDQWVNGTKPQFGQATVGDYTVIQFVKIGSVVCGGWWNAS